MNKKLCLEIGLKKKKKKKEDEPKEEKTPPLKKNRRIILLVILVLIIAVTFLSLKWLKQSKNKETSFFGIYKGGAQNQETSLPREKIVVPPQAKTNLETNNVPLVKRLQYLRIATWNLFPLDYKKITDSEQGPRIAEIIALNDLIALQGFRGKNLAVPDTLLHYLEEKNKKYEYLVATINPENEIYSVFFYNREKVEADWDTVQQYITNGIHGNTTALSATFRTTGVDPSQAFTFVLLNIYLPKDATTAQLDSLFDIYQAVRDNSGRHGIPEDDIILLGFFGRSIRQINALSHIANLAAVHLDKETDLDGSSSENILFDFITVREYTERFGVSDLAKHFNLPREKIVPLSLYRPLWADFNMYESQ